MAPQFALLTGDPRAPGTGNPPADMNNANDALNAMGASFNVMNSAFGTCDPNGVADSTAAFAACMAAAIAANGEMVIPPGTYNLNTGGLHITGPFRMRGLGAGLNNGGTLAPSVRLTSNTSGSLFDFPFSGTGWGGLEVAGVSILLTGTGCVFNGMNLGDSVWRDMDITLTDPAGQAMATTGSISFLNILHERCNFTTTAPTRTRPMISISTSIPAAISNCTFFKCKFSNKGCDNTQFMVHFDCSAASGIAYHYMDNFRECWFEQPYGGAVHCQAGQNITIDACMIWDIFSGQTTSVAAASNGGTISGIAAWANPSAGVLAVADTTFFPTSGTLNIVTSGTPAVISYTGKTPTTFTGCTFTSGTGTVATGASVVRNVAVGNSTFYFGQFPSGANCQGIKVTGCGRSQAGPNGSTTWDVECEATTSQVQVEGWVNKAASVSTLTNAFFNFHGCLDVLLLNNQSPQGASVNGNSTVVVTNPSPTQIAVSQGLITPPPMNAGGFSPADLGYLAWAYDPGLCQGGSLLSGSGVIQLSRVNVRTSIVVTNIVSFISTAGATLTAGDSFVGLYANSGTRIGISADQAASWVSTGTKTAALAGGPFTLTPGTYWVAWLCVGTTMPTFARLQNYNATVANLGAGGTGQMRSAINVSGVTALPSPLVPGSNTVAQVTFWAGLT